MAFSGYLGDLMRITNVCVKSSHAILAFFYNAPESGASWFHSRLIVVDDPNWVTLANLNYRPYKSQIDANRNQRKPIDRQFSQRFVAARSSVVANKKLFASGGSSDTNLLTANAFSLF